MSSLRKVITLILVLAMVLFPLGSMVIAAPSSNSGKPFLVNGFQHPGNGNVPVKQEAPDV